MAAGMIFSPPCLGWEPRLTLMCFGINNQITIKRWLNHSILGCSPRGFRPFTSSPCVAMWATGECTLPWPRGAGWHRFGFRWKMIDHDWNVSFFYADYFEKSPYEWTHQLAITSRKWLGEVQISSKASPKTFWGPAVSQGAAAPG